MKNANLDFYDDSNASLISELMSTKNIPEFVKEAEILDKETLNKLPDNVFALVARDGGEELRKFACFDRGNTGLSVIYFLENKNKLPAEAQKLAALNLIKACGWYGIKPPAELQKTALLGTALKVAPAGMLGVGAVNTNKVRQQALKTGMSGSDVMKLGGLLEKNASMAPWIDITGKSPPNVILKESGKYNCLEKNGQKMYPIDTEDMVKRASSYFMEHRKKFTPFERHEYCVKLASRAKYLGVDVPDMIKKYGSKDMADDIQLALLERQCRFPKESSQYEFMQEMREKCAAYRPEVMATVLEEFDKRNNLDFHWGGSVPDPYYSVFGIVKKAEYSFTYGDDSVNETRLKELAKQNLSSLEGILGKEFVEDFREDPVQLFESMPVDKKRIIMHAASQIES